MKYSYPALYEKTAAFFRKKPLYTRILFICNHTLTIAFFVAYALFLLCAIALEYPPRELTFSIFSPALCLLIVTVLRWSVYRPRPYSPKGANIQPLYHKKGNDEHSFPSRHTACAFVIACVIFPYSIGAGICLTAFGLVLAFARFALGVHYPSDLIGGALCGVLCGLLPLLF